MPRPWCPPCPPITPYPLRRFRPATPYPLCPWRSTRPRPAPPMPVENPPAPAPLTPPLPPQPLPALASQAAPPPNPVAAQPAPLPVNNPPALNLAPAPSYGGLSTFRDAILTGYEPPGIDSGNGPDRLPGRPAPGQDPEKEPITPSTGCITRVSKWASRPPRSLPLQSSLSLLEPFPSTAAAQAPALPLLRRPPRPPSFPRRPPKPTTIPHRVERASRL